MMSVRRCLVLAVVVSTVEASSILSFPTVAVAHPSKSAIAAVMMKPGPDHRLPRLKRLRRHR